MHLSDTTTSPLSWPGQQSEMCASDTFSQLPTSRFSHTDHPVSHIDQTISHVEHLTSYTDLPATHAAKPMSYVGQPHVNQQESSGDQPICVHIGQSMLYDRQPMSHADHSVNLLATHVADPMSYVNQPTSHVNQLVSNADQPICAHIDQPMLYNRQPMSLDDHSVDQPLACLKERNLNKHSHRKMAHIFGLPVVGKSTLAIYVGHEMAKYGVVIRYINMDETLIFINDEHTVTKHYDERTTSALSKRVSDIELSWYSHSEKRYVSTSPQGLIQWAKALSNNTILILDNCDPLLQNNATSKPSLKCSITSTKLHISYMHGNNQPPEDKIIRWIQTIPTIAT